MSPYRRVLTALVLVLLAVAGFRWFAADFRTRVGGKPAVPPREAPAAAAKVPANTAEPDLAPLHGATGPTPETVITQPSASGVVAARPPIIPAEIERKLELLRSQDPEQRAAAVDDLGFSDDPAAEPYVLGSLVNDPSSAVRAAAAAALETHGDSEDAARALVYALGDPAAEVREHALLSLTAIRNATVESELRNSLALGAFPADTALDVRLFLDRYYPKRDPLADFTAP
jgi:hypothetical protein